MFYVLLLRQEAERYRDLAKLGADPKSQAESEDLALVIDEVASELEEKLSAG
ncbi:MAG: hypothetical protein ACHQIO_05450 [Nevskiales bacterium]